MAGLKDKVVGQVQNAMNAGTGSLDPCPNQWKNEPKYCLEFKGTTLVPDPKVNLAAFCCTYLIYSPPVG